MAIGSLKNSLEKKSKNSHCHFWLGIVEYWCVKASRLRLNLPRSVKGKKLKKVVDF